MNSDLLLFTFVYFFTIPILYSIVQIIYFLAPPCQGRIIVVTMAESAPTRLPIHFLDPTQKLPNERCSKLLDPKSALYQWCEAKRKELMKVYEGVAPKRMDFHIELIAKDEEWSEATLLKRAAELEGQEVDLADMGYWKDGVLILTPKDTHITLIYCKGLVKKA